MKMQVNVRTAYRFVVVLITLFMIMSVTKWHFIARPHTTRSEEIPADRSFTLEGDSEITQLIGAEGERINRIDLLIDDAVLRSHIDLFLCDEEQKVLLSRSVIVNEKDLSRGFIRFNIGYDLEKGASYYLKYNIPEIEDWRPADLVAEYRNSSITCKLEDHALTTATANSYIIIDGEEWEEYNLIQRYHYFINFNLWQSLVLIVIIIAAEFVALLFLDKRAWSTEVTTIQDVLKLVINPLVLIGTAVLLIMVYPGKVFGGIWYNILFWDISILMAAGVLLYLINYRRSEQPYRLDLVDVVKNNMSRFLRVVCIAGMLWQAFQYVNGLYNIHHIYAYRRTLIWLFLMLITTYSKKELCRWINLVWIVIGSVIGYIRFKQLAIDDEKVITYSLEAYIIILGGIVIINIVSRILLIATKKESISVRLCKSFLIAFILFLSGMMILSHGREWPFFLAAVCVLLSMRLMLWERRNQFTIDVCNGVTLNYIMMVVFSLMHRPYYRYRAHRYPLGFHTVTVTAVYLTMVLAVLSVRLFHKYKTCSDKRKLIPELLLFGSASNYMLFTLSRTGYMSVIIMSIVTLCLIAYSYDSAGKRIINTIKRMGFIVVIMLVTFPITFSSTRIIPSLVDEPIVYDYEHNDITMYKGTAKDSGYYMDIYRFGQVFASKVLGVGDTVTDAGDIFNNNKGIIPRSLLASASNVERLWIILSGTDEEYDNQMDQFSNGRMTIFKSYIQQSNLWGHDTMGAILPDGEEATHAHNTFLQAVYDHGIIFGILFALFLIYSWILSVVRLLKYKDNTYMLALPVLLCGLMSAGLVEWVFHPCFPICMAMILMLVTLAYNDHVTE